MDKIETRERSSTIIISGHALPASSVGENCESVASSILSCSLRIVTSERDILAAHRLGPKPANQSVDRRSLFVKLRDTELARDIIKSSKTIKVPGLYVSENLTPIRHSILRVLRKTKRSHPNIVSGCGSASGRVFVWVKSPGSQTNQSRKLFVNNKDELHKYCDEILQSHLNVIEPNWSF